MPIGGAEIGAEIVRSIGNARAIIMQNHGVFTNGNSPKQATKFAIEVEEIAMIVHMALLRGSRLSLRPNSLLKRATCIKKRLRAALRGDWRHVAELNRSNESCGYSGEKSRIVCRISNGW